MRKYLYHGKLLLFASIIITSCTNEANEGSATSTTAANRDQDGDPQASLIPGKLDTLYIHRSAFDTLPAGQIVFSFTFRTADTLTLHGWLVRGGAKQFDSLPNFKLSNGRKSPYAYGLGTYFGNVVLSNSDYAKIKVALQSNSLIKFVVFAPHKLGDNIRYKIFTATDISTTLEIATVDPVDADLNPSPPKNY